MITTDMIAFIIASFCAFKDPNVNREHKEACGEFMVNCVILQDGKTTNKVINFCKETWIENEKNKSRK